MVVIGAPGTLGALAAFPKDSRFGDGNRYLPAGAELTFAAGPLTKGPNLCHGTGGNGILFLKLYRRTGVCQMVAGAARAFAMHGIEQYQRMNAQYGRGWYSLWTGDLGFASVFVELHHYAIRLSNDGFFLSTRAS